MIRGERLAALPSRLLAIAALAVVLALPGPAVAAPTSRSAVLPAELANGDVLPVSRRKTFFVPNLASNRVLVFAPYTVNDFRGGWTASKSNTTRWGTTESQTARAKRSFTFALHGGSAQVQAECEEQAAAAARNERGEPAPRMVPDHSLRCSLYGAGGAFELSVENGRGELVGTGGESFTVSAIVAATSRWDPPMTTGMLLRSPGAPVAAVDFAGKGRVVLERGLQSPGRELLAAAAAALLLADLAQW